MGPRCARPHPLANPKSDWAGGPLPPHRIESSAAGQASRRTKYRSGHRPFRMQAARGGSERALAPFLRLDSRRRARWEVERRERVQRIREGDVFVLQPRGRHVQVKDGPTAAARHRLKIESEPEHATLPPDSSNASVAIAEAGRWTVKGDVLPNVSKCRREHVPRRATRHAHNRSSAGLIEALRSSLYGTAGRRVAARAVAAPGLCARVAEACGPVRIGAEACWVDVPQGVVGGVRVGRDLHPARRRRSHIFRVLQHRLWGEVSPWNAHHG